MERSAGRSKHVLLSGLTAAVVVIASGSGFAQQFEQLPFQPLGGREPVPVEDVADWPVTTLTRAYIPEAIDLTERMPPPLQQVHGTCVAYSVAYAARGYYAALEFASTPGERRFIPSPAVVHAHTRTRGDCTQTGSSAARSLDFLIQHGAPDFASVDEKQICSPTLETRKPGPNQLSIVGKGLVFHRGRFGRSARDSDLDNIKQRLAEGHPVMVGFDLYMQPGGSKNASLVYLKAGDIYQGSLAPNAGPTDGHEMVFVGYDERRKAFRVQNSWDTSWAEGGFGWISYAATKADLDDAFVMYTKADVPRPAPKRPGDSRLRLSNDFVCSNVLKTFEIRDDVEYLHLEGFVSNERDRLLLALEHGPEETERVAVRPWPLCEALLTLDEPLLAPARPKIAMDTGKETVMFGDVIGFSVTTPDFPSFLYVVYLQADGTVVNLVPRGGPIRAQTPPNTVLRFGDGKDGRQTFRATAPAGPEAIIAIAARSPMLQLEDLETGEGGQFKRLAAARDEASEGANPQDRLYLTLLRDAINTTEDDKMIAREVAADVMYLTVAEK